MRIRISCAFASVVSSRALARCSSSPSLAVRLSICCVIHLSEIVEDAASDEWEAEHDLHDPRVMGVHVARFGDDQTVIRIRVGRDARSIPPIKLRGADLMQVAAIVMQEASAKHKVDAIFVDGGAVGGGVVTGSAICTSQSRR